MHYVYILTCSDNTLYVGYTRDLKRRLLEHNSSPLGARYTRGRRPVVMIYSEKFRSRSKACKREAEIKKLKREEKLGLVGKGNF